MTLANGVSIIYTPHLAVHPDLPPIIIQFHPHASQDTMINATDQCFQVYLRSNQLPVVLFISSDKNLKIIFRPICTITEQIASVSFAEYCMIASMPINI
jgi:hypothetical protein